MAMVNTMLNLTNVAAATAAANVKDSRWLTLEVCREYQRNKCTRTETECKFAHPPPHVEVQNGRVTACFDSIKGKCQRKDPPCKYLHPPQHLREQLLQNGKNNLILRNLHMQQAAQAAALQIVPGMVPTMATSSKPAVAAYPILPGQYPLVAPQYMTAGSVPTSAVAFSHPYINQSGLQAIPVPSGGTDCNIMTSQIPGLISAIPSQQKIAATRADRLEQSAGIPAGLIPYKRVAVADSKSGLPVYQPGTNMAYQQAIAAMQLQQQQYIPAVTCTQNGWEPWTLCSYNTTNFDSKAGLPVAHPAATVSSQSSPAFPQGMPTVQLPQQQLVPVTMPLVVNPAAEAANALVAAPTTNMVPSNVYSVLYFDANQQLLDTLPVCQDFKLGQCNRPQCKYVHVVEDYVEVKDGRIAVCRDAVRGRCTRAMCKYYHIPINLPNSK